MMSTRARSAAPHHALINSNGGDIQTASLDTFSMLRRKILRAALAVRPFFTSFGRKRLRRSTNFISAVVPGAHERKPIMSIKTIYALTI